MNFSLTCTALQIWTLVIAYVLVVAVYWRPESRRTLSSMALPVWIAVVLHVAAAAGPLRVPLLIAMVTLMVVGFFTEVKQARKQGTEGNHNKLSATFQALSLYTYNIDSTDTTINL